MIDHDNSDSDEQKRQRREDREVLKEKITELEQRLIEKDKEIALLKSKLSKNEQTKKNDD